MNKPIELLSLLGRYVLRLILIGLIMGAVLILLGQEGCMGGFCDH